MLRSPAFRATLFDAGASLQEPQRPSQVLPEPVSRVVPIATSAASFFVVKSNPTINNPTLVATPTEESFSLAPFRLNGVCPRVFLSTHRLSRQDGGSCPTHNACLFSLESMDHIDISVLIDVLLFDRFLQRRS